MRILHVPYSFPPDPRGGTEIYVEGLAAAQTALGLHPAIAAPGPRPACYEHRSLPVWRFGVSPRLTLAELHADGDPQAAEGFGRIVDEFQPDIVHLHGITSAISVRLVAEVSRRGVPFVITCHTPTVTCGRGTLLRHGTDICDGTLDRRTCSACMLSGAGLPRPAAALLGALPPALGRALEAGGLAGGVWTALRMTELTARRIEMFHRIARQAERVVALCSWSRDLLLRNGVPESKLVLCRHGIAWDSAAPSVRPPVSSPGRELKLAFLGRLDPAKGAHVVVRALARERKLNARLDLYGIGQGDAGTGYETSLRSLAANDPRVHFLPPLRPGEVVTALAAYDALLVPSQGFETGPLVVLEAFAAGTPVIGSAIGGIAELVTHEGDGLLVRPFASAEAWAEAIRRFCDHPELAPLWRSRIRPPRHADQTAVEMRDLYEGIVRSPERLARAGATPQATARA